MPMLQKLRLALATACTIMVVKGAKYEVTTAITGAANLALKRLMNADADGATFTAVASGVDVLVRLKNK